MTFAPRDALRVVFLRSPHAHAHIRKLDADAARRLPGVVAVLTGAEAAGDGLWPLPMLPAPATSSRRGPRSRRS